MQPKKRTEMFRNMEKQAISRLLLIVLIVLGFSCIVSAFIFPEIAWVLVICFLYILALETILLTSN